MKYEIEEDLTEDYILKYVSQEEIYEHFLNIPVRLNVKFRSPLRKDKYPTCNFSWYDGKLYYRDWAESSPKDCFNVVQEIYNCNFLEALQIIKRELIIGKNKKVPRVKSEKEKKKSKSKKTKISVKIGKWTKPLTDYLTSYYITKKQCEKFNVFPIQTVWVDGRCKYQYSKGDPALGYYFGKDDKGNQKWKIYFFTRNIKRFITNTNRINGWIQLPETGKNLIITKSLKDVICLDSIGIPSIAMQNETTIPYDYIIEELEQRFENIYSFYDFDYTGIVNANKLKHKYNIPYIFLTNGKFNTYDYKQKDISDYIRANNLEQAKIFLQSCIQI